MVPRLFVVAVMLAFLKKRDEIAADYYALLPRIHAHLKPRRYAEIGIRDGGSLLLAKTARATVGIDPSPQISRPVPSSTKIFNMTSDEFFERHDLREELGGPVDLAFIDGMHRFEFALRDFINFEAAAAPASTILVHDCYPVDRLTAERERVTQTWSGDVWKLVVCLKQYRPDLKVVTIDVPPTGLGVIRGLNPASTILKERLQQLCDEFIPYDYGRIGNNKAAELNRIENHWPVIKQVLS